MPIKIVDENLEDRVSKESQRRKHKTLAKTARELLIERLSELERAASNATAKAKPQMA